MEKRTALLLLGPLLAMSAGPALSGSLDSPASPDATNSAMYSVTDVYNRLTTGAAGALRSGGFVEPGAPPAPTGRTLNEVMDKAPSRDQASGAVTGDVLTGRTFWGLTSNQWGRQTGSVPVQALSPATAAVPAGYYAATNLMQVDTDLTNSNIRAGMNVFGVSGKTEVVDTTSGDAAAADLMSGKQAWVDGLAVTGTIPTQVLSPATAAVSAGYYAATNLMQVDTDLTNSNIRAGMNVFGVSGKTEVVDTTSGDAVAADLMSGKQAWVDGLAVTGTIPTQVLSPATAAVSAGYYAATNLMQVDTDLTNSNIRAGMNVFGVSGKTEVVDTTSGDAVAADLMNGKQAWVDGLAVTGTIPTQVLSPATAAVSAGYYASTNLMQVDTDLTNSNIRAGVNVFGVSGKDEVVDTTSGDAAAEDMLAGKKAWVDGGEVTGNVPAGNNLAGADGALVITITNGLYSGSQTATASDTDLVTGNIKAGANIFGVAGKTEVVDTTTGDALATDLMNGKKAWVDGLAVTGTIPTQVISPATVAVPAGYYASNNLNQVDTDLSNINIRGGTTIFGILGTRYAPLADTGQRAFYRTGDDGDLEPGVTWPATRFVRGVSGAETNTVADNLTGLVWAWNASLLGDSVSTNWNGAVDYCNALSYGGRSDWRLPTRSELASLLDLGQSSTPILPSGHPFTNAVSALYWTSTTDGTGTNRAWFVNFLTGQIDRQAKTLSATVWPVAAGE